MIDFSRLTINESFVWGVAFSFTAYLLLIIFVPWLAPKEVKEEFDKHKGRLFVSIILACIIAFMFVGYRSTPRKPSEVKQLNSEGKLDVPVYRSEGVMKKGDRLQESGQDSLDSFRKRLLKSKTGSRK